MRGGISTDTMRAYNVVLAVWISTTARRHAIAPEPGLLKSTELFRRRPNKSA
jgi:hypothetical protein